MKHFYLLLIGLSLFSCQDEKPSADSIYINANIYTVDTNFTQAEAFAIKDGKFLEIGTAEALKSKYAADTLIDVQGKTILPGLVDAHCHFLTLGQLQQQVNLVGTTSFDDMIKRVLDFQNKNKMAYLRGRGWDQNDWEDKNMPTKTLLDKLFPDTPIALTRIDGHASFCNQAALDLGNITTETKIDGGEVEVINGKLTGILYDNAEQLVMNNWPKPSKKQLIEALMSAQQICFDNGLTSLSDAGPDIFTSPWIENIELIDSLQKSGDLKIRLYMMVPGTKPNLDYYLNKGTYKTERLNVRSFKFYADGALGSRGALLRAPYSDKDHHYGLPVMSYQEINAASKRIAASEFQMNTHAIGDSANHEVLEIYKAALGAKKDRRWRIEHAQVVSPEDFKYFDGILPSIQPTHATSDMYWAEDRLGEQRIKDAYAYKQLLNAYGKIALGTDFPVEQVNPMLTFYAAVARQDTKDFPENGFQTENALTREEALKGMTIWAAHSNFEETEKGSIEAGKFADFIVLDRDIMTVPLKDVIETKVEQTFVGGELQ
ncbi:amidohydrolase [Subsaximicrobium wynnwilliamsii]|uniref:Amidohydrolase n=1 Tax=Subsaximicrobium wynnwilliamsii TaxID=291179 RepID=A0A5C6ZBP7_9FLAO|nr:amidohydrolase [Subsaximicrobium wynnwilliamsii]TXD81089.1 amidohydrolase [Subsaximicrobium wynnwilliamsii]TXD86763.1 amidohydrolase [Subsaximicrobium wynnwilliamsii]TXE00392.1 amidohydrolase [Subsaximicrobium wynnwilliamsii]